MLCKLPKPSATGSSQSFWAFFGILAGGIFSATSAQATLTVQGVSPYSVTSAGVINYAAYRSDSTLTGGFIDESVGFKFLDLTSTSTSDTNNIILFDVQSNKNFGSLTTGQDVVLMATVTINSTQVQVPIAYAGGAFCATGGNSRCQAAANSKYYAVKYSVSGGNELLRVGIYPKDICASPLNNTGTISGCTGSDVEEPTSSALKTLTVRFYLGLEDSTGTNPELGKIADTEENRTITIQLQKAAPTLTCPANLSASYTPGDSEINFNGAAITTAAATSTGTTVGAAVDTLIFLAKTGGTPTSSSSYYNDTSQIIARVSSSSPSVISGFSNTTNGSDNLYNVRILARDRAGVVTDGYVGDGGTGCTASPTTEYQVQTASIRGLLVESQCFIATAAFGSAKGPALQLLRRFRDEILQQHGLGRWFVRTYYRYSPGVAEWLLAHTEWRGWVLQALVAVQVWAWFLLHPVWFLLLLGCVLALILARTRSGRVALVIALCITGPLKSQTAFGEEPQSSEPDFSFIEEIQQRQKEQEQSSGSESESYIEKKKKQLPQDQDYSLIEEIRETQKETPAPESSPNSFVEQKKSALPPSPEESEIEAIQQGRSEAVAKKDDKIGRAFGFKVWTGGSREITAAPGVFYQGYSALYGADYTPDFRFFFEDQLLQSEWFISLGWFFEGGFGWKKTSGGFEFPPQNPAGGTYGAQSSVNFTFITVPVAVGGVARFNLFRVLRPQVKVAPVAVGYFEDRSDSKGLKRGYSRGLLTEAGVAFQLDWLDQRGSWSMYETLRVKQHFLTLDYHRLDTTSGAVDLSFHGFTLGLLFEI
jgi:hypothetical protein